MKLIDIPFNRTYEYDDLHKLAKAMCTNKPMLQFSIFKTNEELSDSERWMVNAPDIDSTEPVFTGLVQFVADYWRISDVPLHSKVVENPTWMTIINIFNDMLQNGDGQGIYLEGLYEENRVGGIQIYRFAIGS